jgi:hypothetical protein
MHTQLQHAPRKFASGQYYKQLILFFFFCSLFIEVQTEQNTHNTPKIQRTDKNATTLHKKKLQLKKNYSIRFTKLSSKILVQSLFVVLSVNSPFCFFFLNFHFLPALLLCLSIIFIRKSSTDAKFVTMKGIKLTIKNNIFPKLFPSSL